MLASAFFALFGLVHAVSHPTNPPVSSLSSTDLDHTAPHIFRLANRAPPTSGSDAPLRNIYWLNDAITLTLVDPETGQTLMPSHSAIFIDGPDSEGRGPLKIEISHDDYEEDNFVRVFELPGTASGKLPSARAGRTLSLQGQTALTNEDFVATHTGLGVVADAWAEDPEFRTGVTNKGNLNVCHSLAARILKALGHEPNAVVKHLVEESNKWSEQQEGGEMKILLVVHDEAGASIEDNTYRTRFMLKDGGTGKDIKWMDGAELDKAEAIPMIDEANSPEAKHIPSDQLVIDKDLDGLPDSSVCTTIDAGDGACKIPKPADPSTADPEKGLNDAAAQDGGLRTNLARVGGNLQSFTALGKTALTVLGVAGDLVGAAFVVLDFVNHNWVGAAFGVFGLAAGVATGLAVSGPVGWFIGGFIAALFAILPGLFGDSHPPAKITDVQGILQWSFFGDSTHTGNEQCQKGTSDVPGNPNCTALYGAGPLSLSLKLDNFDAIIFLLQFNQGYPMSLKEIAAAFNVVDTGKSNMNSTKHIGSIKCNNRPQIYTLNTGLIGDDPDLCNHPTYTVDRDLITLPGLNKTASEIYNRIIPAPGGDCKLLAYPGDQYFPSYNLTISGLPDAIACGLTSALNISGVAVPLVNSTGSASNATTDLPPPTVVSNGTDSTNGQNGAFIAPPPPSPFRPLLPSSYPCLAVSPTSSAVCLPPGTYTPPHTSTLEIDLVHVTTLTFPPTTGSNSSSSNQNSSSSSWSLSLTARTIPQLHIPPRRITRNYTTDQPDPTNNHAGYFASDIALVAHNVENAASFTIFPPTDSYGPEPVCCLFADPNYGADALCLGVGGGDLPPEWQAGVVQSVQCHGGGWVWLYAQRYGDDGATVVKGDVPDLKEVPYGAQEGGSFSKNVRAAWVLKGN